MLGEISIFPREHVKSIEDSLLGLESKVFTDVQVCKLIPYLYLLLNQARAGHMLAHLVS